MDEDRLVKFVERHAWLIIAVACCAATFLSFVNFTWTETADVLRAQPPPAEGWRLAMIGAAWIAFAICVGAMLLAVTVEARRMRRLRESLSWWHHPRPESCESAARDGAPRLTTCPEPQCRPSSNEHCKRNGSPAPGLHRGR